MTQTFLNDLQYKIVGCAIEVHKQMGPGLLESVYEECLFEELQMNNLLVKRQIEVPLFYKGRRLATPLRLDLLVEDAIIIECKSTKDFAPIHKAQLLSYLMLCHKTKGLLINFKVKKLVEDGLKVMVTEKFRELPQ